MDDDSRFSVVLFPKFFWRMMSLLEVEVFSSETGQWSVLVTLCPVVYESNTVMRNVVPHNGELYWLIGLYACIEFDPFNNNINFFDNPTPIDNVVREEEEHGNMKREWKLDHKVYLKDFVVKNCSNFEKESTGLVVGFNPSDGNIVYLYMEDGKVVLCDILQESLQVVSCKLPENKGFCADGFPLVFPWWPTPLPPKQVGWSGPAV
ncbi:F-box protein [Quillaja saponaria]|uniref:F-box protein n=1 Tax=Quillaja saponaria TaxID=32244 RepID=A0AAD7LTQ9_QUISA|nr:F-box protein [Quillaja saponaria]